MGRKCNHKTTRFDWGRDAKGAETAIAHWCIGCGERLGLGPSNDESEAVKLEMETAAIVAPNSHHMQIWSEQADGFGAHRLDSDPPDGSTDLWHAGWLAKEIYTHDDDREARDADAWSWDPSRPIAEQLAETARDDAAADALDFPLTVAISSDEQGLAVQIDGLDTAPPLLTPDEADTLADGLRSAASKIRAATDLNAMEYEATRDAEPDCRDEDDDDIGPTPRAAMPDPVVCSCHGDALGFETCADYEKWRDFDPFATAVPGDFGGPHGDIP